MAPGVVAGSCTSSLQQFSSLHLDFKSLQAWRLLGLLQVPPPCAVPIVFVHLILFLTLTLTPQSRPSDLLLWRLHCAWRVLAVGIVALRCQEVG